MTNNNPIIGNEADKMKKEAESNLKLKAVRYIPESVLEAMDLRGL